MELYLFFSNLTRFAWGDGNKVSLLLLEFLSTSPGFPEAGFMTLSAMLFGV